MKRSQGKSFGGGGSGAGGFGAGSGSSLSYLTEPPSFASISDPNVVVSLKSILKKDSTTKAKGLEDLLSYVQSHPHEKDGGAEQAILDAWVQMYPRISIDNSRRVRELSHNVQLELLKSARKRMEKYIPKIVGAWLAGLYDRDRVVARAANDGLTSFLTTPERISAFWTKCQAQILDFSIEGLQETQDTLSDERSTTKEDAQAKYFRVVAASLSLVLGLLQRTDASDIERASEKYDDFFKEGTAWDSITLNDSQVRKAACQLFFVCLNRELSYGESKKARQAFVTGGLKTNQAGSALEYVRTLTKLTQRYPEIWKGDGSEKKSSIKRLQSFIAKGSQGSPTNYWEYLDQLLAAISDDSLSSLDGASSLLTALKSGVTNREEPRTNTSLAWKCYIDTAKRLLNLLDSDNQVSFCKEHLFPLFEQFLFSVSDKQVAIPTGPNAISVLVGAHVAMSSGAGTLVSASAAEWDRLATLLCKKIANSLPEVSKEYQVSQDKIAEEGRRWFAIVGQIHTSSQTTDSDCTANPSETILSQCTNLLYSRDMKPYGAARILEFALSTSGHLFRDGVAHELAGFFLKAGKDLKLVLESPSSRYILSCISLMASSEGLQADFVRVWTLWSASVLDSSCSTDVTDSALAELISGEKAAELTRANEKLQSYIVDRTVESAKSGQLGFELLDNATTYNALSNSASKRITETLIKLLVEKGSQIGAVLDALEIIGKKKSELITQNESVQATLLASLLSFTEISDPSVSAKAAAVKSLLESHSVGTIPVVNIIQNNLERASHQSLEIETLVKQAHDASVTGVPLEDIFPNTNLWMKALTPFLERPVDPSLSITNILGGATELVGTSLVQKPQTISRDRKGRSVPVRMALYTSLLMKAPMELNKLPRQFQVELLYLQCLTAQLVSDQITLMAPDGMWKTLNLEEMSSQAEGLVTSIKTFVNERITLTTWWKASEDDEVSVVLRGLMDLLVEQSKTLSPQGFYSARCLAEALQAVTEVRGLPSSLEERFTKPELLKATPEAVLSASAILAGFRESLQASKSVNNFLNRLISDAAGASAGSEKTKIVLLLLTASAGIFGVGELPVANNRIVFATKQITTWLDAPEQLSAGECAEVCRGLSQLLPNMKEVYGSYWEKTVGFCLSLSDRAAAHPLAEALPFIHTSLKLTRSLEKITDGNDDLQDAMGGYLNKKPAALLELLRLDRSKSSGPLEIVDGMLCREVDRIPVRSIPEAEEIFGLVASESKEIQTAAYTMLHKAIPMQQEQKSVEALLDNTDARLPDELLSLLLDAPTLDKYSDDALARFPTSIRCYLLSWQLVFDAYAGSSFKIRNDFTENLKAENYTQPLLDFTFDVLGHSIGRPMNLDKAGITPDQVASYDVKLADSETGEKSMQWLLVHLFYLTLKYTPGLFRRWYLESRSKQTKIAVESWTTKYFSPLIVSDTLDEVQSWGNNQEPPAADEQELIVKVSRNAKEVTAGYEIDESEASIVIKVPPSYPIEGVTVIGLHRVAVSEKKWQSWIMTTQGVITFSNGNIVDGLQVFKRNIVGAMKGQAECAICYSIISSDKKMPDKKCGTCKNLFHRICLYKWFQTSNQNTCPLCRNPIDYIGADTQKRRAGGV